MTCDRPFQALEQDALTLYRQELADLDVKEHTINKQKEVLEAFANRIASYNAKNEVNYNTVYLFRDPELSFHGNCVFLNSSVIPKRNTPPA